MAEVPYTQGVGGVNAEVNTPNDYQNIHATAGAFGGAIDQGLQEFGQGAEKAADFYSKAVVDSTYNDAAKKMGYVVHGDPNKTITGPDGSVQIDTGFLGKKERDAMDSRPSAEQQIEQIIEEGKKNLQSPQQQHEFESSIRRLQNQHIEQIGAHTNQQANAWYGSTNKSSVDLALSNISRNANDPEIFSHGVADLQNALLNQVRLEGGGAVQVQDAIQRAAQMGTRARIEAIGVSDPYRAQQMVEKNKDVLGMEYAPLALQVKSRADAAYGDFTAQQKLAAARANKPLSDPTHPLFDKITSSNQGGYSSNGLAKTMYIESGGKANAVNGKYVGLTQMGPWEFKTYGPPGGDINNPEDNLYAANNYAKHNAQILSMKLGKPPEDSDIYMAHQQGAGGAVELFKNPNALAVDLVGEKAITGNVDPKLREQAKNWTAKQFTDYWRDRFNNAPITGGVIAGVTKNTAPSTTMNLNGVDTASQAPVGGEAQPGTIQKAGIPTLGQSQVSGAPTVSQPSSASPTMQATQTINQGLEYEREHAMQSTYDDVQAGRMTHDQAQKTYEAIQRDYTVRKVAEDSNEKLKQQLENQTASDLYDKMDDPLKNGNIINEIKHAPGLGTNIKLKEYLVNLATNPDKDRTTSSPKYLETLGKVTTGEISSMSQLYRMQIDGQLKQRDVDELSKSIMHMQSDPDERELQTKKKDALKNIETQVAYFGLEHRPFASQEGKSYFNANVVNSFETQFKQFRQTPEGQKDPYKFFDDKNIQKFIQGAPGKAQVGVAALKDTPENTVAPTIQPAQSVPAIPQEISKSGVTDLGWKQVMGMGPMVNGQPVHIDNWDKIVTELIRSPDPTSIADFNAHLSPYGVTAEDILKKSKSTGEMEGLYKGQTAALGRSGL